MIETTISAKTGARTVRINGAVIPDTPEAIRAAMVCTPRQARLAMMQTPRAGMPSLLTAVEAAVYGSNDAALILAWDYATEWRRNDPMIEQIGGALGLTDDEIDKLFHKAMGL